MGQRNNIMVIKRDCICTPVGKNRPLHIYLPEGYEESEEQYPVMYFFDGHNLFSDEDATYGKCWGLKSFLDSWDKPVIIVGFECGHEGDERLSEYSPYYFNSNYIGRVDGIGDEILRWITEEVKPMIDSEFRTYYFREATGIGGSSMGGLMALYGAVRFNRFFSKAACLSPTVIPCYRKLKADIRNAEPDQDTKLWLSFGESEAFARHKGRRILEETKTFRYNTEFREMLENKNVSAKLHIQKKGRHCEADWEKQIPLFMDYLWK